MRCEGDRYRDAIVKELAEDPNLEQLLQDPYANYVIQSALSVAQVGESR